MRLMKASQTGHIYVSFEPSTNESRKLFDKNLIVFCIDYICLVFVKVSVTCHALSADVMWPELSELAVSFVWCKKERGEG